MYSFYKPGIKKNSILVHEHDLVWIFWYVWYTEEFVILPVTMDLFGFFFTCFLHIVGIRVSRTSKSCKSLRQTCIFDNGPYNWFHINNCSHISCEKIFHVFIMWSNWVISGPCYVYNDLYHVKLCIERERTAFVLLKWLNVVFLCVIFNCACLVRSV